MPTALSERAFTWAAILSAAAASTCFSAPAQAQCVQQCPRYEVFWIEPYVFETRQQVFPFALSENGIAVGHIEHAPDSGVPRGFTFDLARLMRLMGGVDQQPYGNSFGRAINGYGRIVGSAAVSETGGQHAVIASASDGEPLPLEYLPNLPGARSGGNGEACAINDSEVIVGLAGDASDDCGAGFCYGGPSNPVRWTDGAIEALPVMAGTYAGAAMDVNESGDVAGFFLIPHRNPDRYDDCRGFRLPAGAASPVPLDALGGIRSRVFRMLDDTTCFGFAELPDQTYHAAQWGALGQVSDLGTLEGFPYSVAMGADPTGRHAVGGVSRTELAAAQHNIRMHTERAVLFEDGNVIPLDSLVQQPTPGLYFNNAYAISSAGWIVGDGGVWRQGVAYHMGYLLVPLCCADFNGDGFLDFFDYDEFVQCFETGMCPEGATADFNGDGFVDFFDYDDFVGAFEVGC